MTSVGATESSPRRVRSTVPVAPTQSPRSRSLTAGERLLAEDVDAAEELQVAGGVADDEEDDLALVALGDDAPGDGDDVVGLRARLEVGVASRRARPQRCGDVEAIAVRLVAGGAQRVELGPADGEGVVLGRGSVRLRDVVGHARC